MRSRFLSAMVLMSPCFLQEPVRVEPPCDTPTGRITFQSRASQDLNEARLRGFSDHWHDWEIPALCRRAEGEFLVLDKREERADPAQVSRRYLTARGGSLLVECIGTALGAPLDGRHDIEGEALSLTSSDAAWLEVSASDRHRLGEDMPRGAFARLELPELADVLRSQRERSLSKELTSDQTAVLVAWMQAFADERNTMGALRVITSPLEDWIWPHVDWRCRALEVVDTDAGVAAEGTLCLRLHLSGEVHVARDVAGVESPGFMGFTFHGTRTEQVAGRLSGACEFRLSAKSGAVLECRARLEYSLDTVVHTESNGGNSESLFTSTWNGELSCALQQGARLELWLNKRASAQSANGGNP